MCFVFLSSCLLVVFAVVAKMSSSMGGVGGGKGTYDCVCAQPNCALSRVVCCTEGFSTALRSFASSSVDSSHENTRVTPPIHQSACAAAHLWIGVEHEAAIVVEHDVRQEDEEHEDGSHSLLNKSRFRIKASSR